MLHTKNEMQRGVVLVLLFAALLAVDGLEVWPQPSVFQRGGTILSINPSNFVAQTTSSSSLLKVSESDAINKLAIIYAHLIGSNQAVPIDHILSLQSKWRRRFKYLDLFVCCHEVR